MRWIAPYIQWLVGYATGGFAMYASLHGWDAVAGIGIATIGCVIWFVIDGLRERTHA